MKRTTKIALAVGTALSLGLGAAAVSAHPDGMGWGNGFGMGYGMHGGYGMGPGAGMHGGGMGPQGMFNANPGAAEDRLAALKSELGITAGQETAWQTFVTAVRQRDTSRVAWFAQMHGANAPGTLPERLKQRDEMFKQHQGERQAATSALLALYSELTPEQKTVADRRFGGFGPGPGAAYRRGSDQGPGEGSR